MFPIYSWLNVILHLDGDAFFASVTQAVNPSLKGKPLVTGREKGIATSFSYEAKKAGVRRGMRFFEIEKICPNCVFVESDYEVYSLFSQKMFDILRTFSPVVEEYSIDEGFADLKGLRRPLNMSYLEIGKAIKKKIEKSLGITISVGVSLTKSLAKLASSYKKPSGLVVIDGPSVENFLKGIPINKVWGIGPNTSAYLIKMGINTAYELAIKPEFFVKGKLSKPYFEIWRELRGEKVYELDPKEKTEYKSISRTQTFTPPLTDPVILKAKLMKHIEEAFEKARKLKYQIGKLSIFLKTQKFQYFITEIKLSEPTAYPMMIRDEIETGFKKIYKKGVLFRTTGCTISDLTDAKDSQSMLFSDNKKLEKAKKIYPLYESGKINFGSCLFDKEKNKPRQLMNLFSLKLK
jgi:DNA polymerase IV